MIKKSQQNQLQIEDLGTIDDKTCINIASDISYNHGEDVVIYDVREKSPFVSYYIVCSCSNEAKMRKVISSADESLVNNNKLLDHKEGKKDSKWVLLDARDIVIQIFLRDERERVKFDALYIDCPHKVVTCDKEIKYEKR